MRASGGLQNVRVEDLHMSELMEAAPDRGLLRFAGQRAILLDTETLRRLRDILIEVLGPEEARGAISKMGFVRGWRLGEAVEHGRGLDGAMDLRRALPRLAALQGLFSATSDTQDPLAEGGMRVNASVEAEDFLARNVRTTVPVCHAARGLVAGYLSYVSNQRVEVVETECIACGDQACTFQAQLMDDERTSPAKEESMLHAALDGLLASLPKHTQPGRRQHRVPRASTGRPPRDPESPELLGLAPDIYRVSARMRKVMELAAVVAGVDSSILITGETGVGKERVARFIHEHSNRAGPFIAVNCGAITETLLESELFGHARGAFTGAAQDRAGLFEAAQHGTLMLDEIGEVSPVVQVKLLRVLQQREVRRVGENVSRPVDVRLISATNRNLTPGSEELGFRRDLYYRIKVVELMVPPLRHRHEDILPLARVLLEAAAKRTGRKLNGMTSAVADHLLKYPWPGNVRELENVMEHAVVLAKGDRVELDDLPEELREAARPKAIEAIEAIEATGRPTTIPRVRPLDDVFRECIMTAMEINDGNQRVTAEQLGISMATLYRRLKRYSKEAAT